MSKRKTTEQFKRESQDIHGTVYDYSLVEYVDAHTKVAIVCPEHGTFYQKPNDHIRGIGCRWCGSRSSSNSRKTTTETFIDKSKNIHGDAYEYSSVNYSNARTKVRIICKKHGYFEQTPNSHLSGHGCPLCGNDNATTVTRYTTESFIEKATVQHKEKYDYSTVKYTTAHEKVTIVCPKHGPFEQVASKHLQGHECRACSRRNHSSKALNWLNDLATKTGVNIQHAENGGEYRIPGTRFFVDGFCEETNTVYEFYGDVYHGNPQFNPLAACHPYDKTVTARDLYEKTTDREDQIKKLGYNLVVMWENDPKMIKRFS